ncbi:hypothetical protein LCGC14_2506520, partial [marine sediment metagenome]
MMAGLWFRWLSFNLPHRVTPELLPQGG